MDGDKPKDESDSGGNGTDAISTDVSRLRGAEEEFARLKRLPVEELRVDELRQKCKEAGLRTSGRKQELIQRLKKRSAEQKEASKSKQLPPRTAAKKSKQNKSISSQLACKHARPKTTQTVPEVPQETIESSGHADSEDRGTYPAHATFGQPSVLRKRMALDGVGLKTHRNPYMQYLEDQGKTDYQKELKTANRAVGDNIHFSQAIGMLGQQKCVLLLLVMVVLCLALVQLILPGAQHLLPQAKIAAMKSELMHMSHHVRFLLADVSWLLWRAKSLTSLCGMEAIINSDAMRHFVPQHWHESLQDAADFLSNKRRTKGVGILLVCDTQETCTEVIENLRNTLEAGSWQCQACFEFKQGSGMIEGVDLAGRLQKQLTRLLRKCPDALYLVDGALGLSESAAKVFINALSEHGHFQDSGEEIAANKGTYIFTISVNVTDNTMAPEEFTRQIMGQVYSSWISGEAENGSGKGGRMDKETALALRRRIDFSLPLQRPPNRIMLDSDS